jgi:hypothetical protein
MAHTDTRGSLLRMARLPSVHHLRLVWMWMLGILHRHVMLRVLQMLRMDRVLHPV